MPQPESQTPQTPHTPQQNGTEPVDTEVQFYRRGRTALWVTSALLLLSLMVLTVGFLSATRTDNVSVAGFYSGITLSFGAFLGIVALHLIENRRPMLIASIIFISMGIIAAFLCAIVDGIIASQFIDIRPLEENMCDYYGSASGYAYDNYYTKVTCRASTKACQLTLESHTCYCCYLYNCESEYQAQYFQFTGVSSCWDVIHLHRLLWSSVVLNVVAMFLGIINAALLGAYKDLGKLSSAVYPSFNASAASEEKWATTVQGPGIHLQIVVQQKPSRNIPPSPAPSPHILYNPNQHILTYASFGPPQALPAYPNYPIPIQPNPCYPAPAAPQPIPEGGYPANPHPVDAPQSQQPPLPSGQPPHQPIAHHQVHPQVHPQLMGQPHPTVHPHPQSGTQETGLYPSPNAPNAPVLYGEAYGACEKPPPYAY